MPHPLVPDNSFPPARNAPCFCGSGERFKRCCGNQASERKPPFGVQIIDQFLSAQERASLLHLADATPGKPFTVPDGKGGRMHDEQRVTEWVDFRDSHQQLLDDVVARAFEQQIIPMEGRNIAWYEEPQLLRYTPGGYYLHHSDAYQLVPEQRAWRKVVDRDISVLIYLNDGYEGGELEFKRLFYRLRPRAGMLVWFPSDVRYEHMAKPVISGQRSVIVSWAAAAGIERVQPRPANRAIFWPNREKQVWSENDPA
jgi:predicted 2-oxoglutarate/Fe(II)-dependent dioxygenase YbiX